MKILVFTADGDCCFSDQPLPIPNKHQVLIRVQCAALDRYDILRTEYSERFAVADHVPGRDVFGTIVSLGEAVSNDIWKIGDQVAALLNNSACAEFAIADTSCTIRRLDGLSPAVMSTIPSALLLSHFICFSFARITSHDVVALFAADTCIGEMMHQLLKKRGIEVIAFANNNPSSSSSDHAISSIVHEEARIKEVHSVADVILDPFGPSHLSVAMQLSRTGARIISYDCYNGFSSISAEMIREMYERNISLQFCDIYRLSDKNTDEISKVIGDGEGLSAIINSTDFTLPNYKSYTFDPQNVLDAFNDVNTDPNLQKVAFHVNSASTAVHELGVELEMIREKNRWIKYK